MEGDAIISNICDAIMETFKPFSGFKIRLKTIFTLHALICILGIMKISAVSTSVIEDDQGIHDENRQSTSSPKTAALNKHQQTIELKMAERFNELENKFDQAISKLKMENEDQTEEIAVLKAAKKKHDIKINALESEISQLKAYSFNHTVRMDKIEKMIEDHYKTISDEGLGDAKQPKTTFLRTSSELSENADTSSAAILPTSCNDLSTDGHRLNGIYLLFDLNFQKFMPTFCDFKNGGIGSKQLGILNIKSSVGVYFYVQRNKIKDDDNAKVIKFNVERLNVGNAMNVETGVFTAPTPGIYQFSFSISKYGYFFGEVFVGPRLNGVEIGLSISNSGVYSGVSTFQSILKLKKGDRIDLYKKQGKIAWDSTNLNHFIGLLLEENLSLTNGN